MLGNYKKEARGEKTIQYSTSNPKEYSIQTNLSFTPSRITCRIYRGETSSSSSQSFCYIVDSEIHDVNNRATNGDGEYGYFANSGISKNAFKIVLDSDYPKGYFRIEWRALS